MTLLLHFTALKKEQKPGVIGYLNRTVLSFMLHKKTFTIQ